MKDHKRALHRTLSAWKRFIPHWDLNNFKALKARLKIIGIRSISFKEPPFFLEGLNQVLKLSSRETIVVILAASLAINLLSIAFPIALLQVYDRVIPNHSLNTLSLLLLGVFSALILESILRIGRSYVAAWVDAKYEHRLTCKVFSHLMHTQITAFEKKGIGAHLDDLNSLNYVRSFYASQALSTLMDAPFIFLFLGLIAYIGGWLVFLPVIILLGLLIYSGLINKNIEMLKIAQQEQADHEINFLINTLSNVHTVKSFGLESQMLRRYERLEVKRSLLDSYSNEEDTELGLGRQIGSQAALILVALFGGLLVLNGSLTIGSLAACTLLTGRCIQPLNSILSAWTRMQTVKLVRRKMIDLLQLPQECPPGKQSMGAIQGTLRLENISLKNINQTRYLFKNLNLQVKKGETIAIRANGQKGKSTLAQLFMGYIPPESGKIMLDGKNIFEYDLNSVREQIAYIPQNSDLLAGTIMDNITLFNEANRPVALRLSRVLGLINLVKEMPRGFDTEVGKNPVTVIGQGVKQRMMIIRALLKQPKILIFDEGNAALDFFGNRDLLTLLHRIKQHCTMILITEWQPAIRLADRVYELDQHLRELA